MMLEMEKAHQIPSSPRAVLLKIMANGILAEVNTTLMTEQRSVLPRPERAPTVVSSIHMNIWQTPRITR